MALAIGNNLGAGILKALLYQANNLTGVHFKRVSFSTGKPDSLSQMAANTRNLLLFTTLAGAALLTWVFARVTEEPSAPSVGRGPTPESYYLIGATLQGTDDNGRIYYRVISDRVEQLANGEDFLLEKMSVEYTPDTNIRWNIYAERGLTDANRGSWRLQEGVRLTYAPDSDQDETIFETDELQLDTQNFFAATGQVVTMYKGPTIITATGLELDLKTDNWILGWDDTEDSDVTIRTAH